MRILVNRTIITHGIDIPSNDFEIAVDLEAEVFLGSEVSAILDNILKRLRDDVYLTSGVIRLVLSPNNRQIDLGIFGMLCLIKMTRPSVRVAFDLTRLGEKSKSQIAFKIRQYCASSYLFCRKVIIEIQYLDRFYNIETIQAKDSWLQISNKFLPIFSVDNELFQSGFRKAFNGSFIRGILKDVAELEADNGANKLLISKGLSISFPEYCLLSFVGALEDIRLLAPFVHDYNMVKDGSQPKLKQWTKIGGDMVKDYYTPTRPVLNNALQQAPIFILVFARLLSNILVEFTTLPKERAVTYSDLTKKVIEIYDTAYIIFHGLREIAANIVEHSGDKQGLLLARIFSLEEIIEFKKNAFPHIEAYAQQLNQSHKKYLLDITVFDLGTTGMVESFNKKTLPGQQMVLNKFSAPDSHHWGPDKKNIRDFFQFPASGLGHEVHRMIANAGLIIFKRNIDLLDGWFLVSSPGEKKGETEFFSSHDMETTSIGRCFYSCGTYYNIMFPLWYKELSDNTLIRVQDHMIWNNNPENSDILNYWYTENSNDRGEGTKLQRIAIKKSEESVDSKYMAEQDIVNQVVQGVKSQDIRYLIPVLDLSGAGFEASGPGPLIRFLASVWYRTGMRDIVVTGCTNDVVSDVIRMLGQKQTPFWGETLCVVFYVPLGDYFIPIVLFGNEYKNCTALNYFANDISIGNEQHSLHNLPDISSSRLFFQPLGGLCRMVEIDTVIQIGELSIFEHYARTCLMKELND